MKNLDEELVKCAKVGDLGGVKKMLESGAYVHDRGDLALRWASHNGHVEVVEFLLESGADIHAYDDEALRHASENGYVGVVEVLLEHGADVHVQYDYALRWASDSGYVSIVVKLVEAGANLRALSGCWIDLFDCKAPVGLEEMSVGGVVELLLAEAVARELV